MGPPWPCCARESVRTCKSLARRRAWRAGPAFIRGKHSSLSDFQSRGSLAEGGGNPTLKEELRAGSAGHRRLVEGGWTVRLAY